jgi:ABC-type microcin C transport system duplicated ATPase subunit YejF
MRDPVLEIRNLYIGIEREDAAVDGAVRGVSLSIGAGEIYGLVGESGCGKTLTALAVAGLLPPSVRVTDGTILFGGEDLLELEPAQRRKYNGRNIGMVFQEPLTALNPLMRIGTQIGEPLRIHTDLDTRQIRPRVIEMMARVGLPEPETLADRWPHHFQAACCSAWESHCLSCCAPSSPHRGRTYHRAGCHDTGANPASAPGTVQRCRDRDAVHLTRYGRGQPAV